MSAKDDIAILAKAASIMKDNKRKAAAEDALKKRKVDMVAGKGSFAVARRERGPVRKVTEGQKAGFHYASPSGMRNRQIDKMIAEDLGEE